MSEDLLLARLARRPGLVDSPLGAIAAPYVSALRAALLFAHHPQLPEPSPTSGIGSILTDSTCVTSGRT